MPIAVPQRRVRLRQAALQQRGLDQQPQRDVRSSPVVRLVPGVNAQVVTGTVLLSSVGSQPWGDNGQGTLREFTPAAGSRAAASTTSPGA